MKEILTSFRNQIRANSRVSEYKELLTLIEQEIDKLDGIAQPKPEPTFFWKDKTGRGLTNTLPLGVIRADTTTDTNYDGKKLRKWAKNAEIGEVWENESEHYTRIS